MNLIKRTLTLLLCAAMIITYTPLSMITAYADAGDVPAHSKDITDNGDGTYTLELSVTGDADNETQEAGKVNVLIVYDTSSSMTSNAQGSSYTRADQAEDVVHDFLTNLATYQNAAKNNINVALVTFARYTDQHNNGQTWTTNVTGLANRFDDGGTDRQTNFSYSGNQANGTNWDAALDKANDLVASAPGINADPKTPTFVIMMTDGACTASGDGSNAIAPTNARISQLRDYYSAATGNAEDVATACQNSGGTFYGIYAYGTEADLLDDLMYYSVNGQHRGGSINNVVAATEDAPNFFLAANTASLNDAIDEIFDKVVQAMGIASVSISDGTTNQVETSTGEISELLEVDEGSYKYWISIPVVGGRFTRVDRNGNTIQYTVTQNNDGTCRVTWGSNSVTVKGSVSGGQFKYEWEEANALYNFDPPDAEFVDGAVDWDLSSVGTLLDGVTYSVTFDVYPSQTTLDAVADIKNDPYVSESNPGAWGDLDPKVQQYIGKDGKLETNTTATLSYVDTRTGQSGSSEYENPDPVPTQTVEELAVSKEWDNQLESDWEKPESITLGVMRDTERPYTVTLNDGNDWQDKVFISIGIIKDGEVLEGAEGHDFTFTEPAIQGEGFKWEINVPTVHPMMIDGVVTSLVKVDENHPLPEGATYYDFNNARYYVDDESVSLTAINERRSSVNLTKVVDGEDAPEDAVFPWTINVVDPLAPDTAPSEEEDPGHDSDYWIWISIRDKDGNRINEGVEGATSAGSGWWYAPSGTNVTIPVKAGYSIRLNNLPKGTTYTVTEGDLPESFVFKEAEVEIVDGKDKGETPVFTVDESKKELSSSVEDTNNLYLVTFTNEYDLTDVTVDKVWVDNNDYDEVRPETLELTLNGAPSGTTIPDPVITKSTDGNTWTYTWSGLPRFDSDGDEIVYTVTEETVPDEYDCEPKEKTVDDGGIIKNIHVPKTGISVQKVWDDNNDSDRIRPDSVQVQLYADEEASGDPVELTEENWTHTWTGLPIFRNESSGDDSSEAGSDTTDPDDAGKAAATDEIVVEGSGNEAAPAEEEEAAPAEEEAAAPAEEEEAAPVEKAEKAPAAEEEAAPSAEEEKVEETPAEEKKEEAAPDEEKREEAAPAKKEKAEKAPATRDEAAEAEDDDDQKIVYKVEEIEDKVITGKDGEGTYAYKVEKITDEEGNTIFLVTNTHTPTKTKIDGTKTWNDNDYEERPSTITVSVYQQVNDGLVLVEDFANLVISLEEGDDVDIVAALNENGVWEFTIDGLPKYEYDEEGKVRVDEDGKPIEVVYVIAEAAIEGYITTQSGNDIVNTRSTSATVVKVWNDAEDQDGKRPSSLTVTLTQKVGDGAATPVKVKNDAGEEVDKTETLNEDNEWTATVDGLPMYNAAGSEIVYGWTEGSLPSGYTLTSTTTQGTVTTLTNSYTPEVTSISVTKVWDDANDQDGYRLTAEQFAAKIHLMNGNTEVTGYTPTVTPNANGTFTVTYSGMPKYANKVEITYSVKEDAIAHYTPTPANATAENGGTIKNSHTPEVTSISITKAWDDANDQDGYRLTAEQFAAKIHLMNGSTEVTGYTPTVTPNANGTFTVTYSGMPKFANKQEITYSVKEDAITHYTPTPANATAENGGTIKNSHTPEVTSISITKEWDDADDQDGYRLTAAQFANKIHLMNGNTEVMGYTPTVTDNGNGTYTVTYSGMPKYANKVEITYSVKEDSIAEYTTQNDTAVDGGTIKNTHTPETVSVEGTKTWDDAELDGITGYTRPTSITVTLSATVGEGDDEETLTYADLGLESAADLTKTVTATDNWSYSWTDLPKNHAKQEITYTVTETDIDGFTKEMDNYSVINTPVVEEEHNGISLTIKKVDANTGNGLNGVKFTLAGEGKTYTYTTATVDGEVGVATITFDDDADTQLPKKGDYTLTETKQTGYAAGAEYAIEVDQSITIEDKTATDGFWKKIFSLFFGNSTAELFDEGTLTLTVPNTPEPTSVDATKVWSDASDQDGKRPDSVTFKLYKTVGGTESEVLANGQPVTKTLTKADAKVDADTGEKDEDTWVVTFENLPSYEDGQQVTYTVKELKADGETAVANFGALDANYVAGYSEDKLTVTNVINKESLTGEGQVEVTKELIGQDLTANQFTFQLLDSNNTVVATGTNAADGKVTMSAVTFTAAGTYSYTLKEVIPDDAVAKIKDADGNVSEVAYKDATAEQKAAGGFIKNDIRYDSTTYPVTATVTRSDTPGKLDVQFTVDSEAVTFINTKGHVALEITKNLKDYLDHETNISATFVFEINGYEEGNEEPVYTKQVGVALDKAGSTSTMVEEVPYGLTYTVEEIYYGSYKPDPEDENPKEVSALERKQVDGKTVYCYTVAFDNKYNKDSYSGGVVNKYVQDGDKYKWSSKEGKTFGQGQN